MIRTTPLWLGLGAWVTLTACYPPPSRLNAPPQGTSQYPHELQKSYVHMLDNAMLADMAMADIHFVPHTSELNSLGERRLKRYAKLLEVYGGTLRYDTALRDRKLIDARIKHIREFLALEGIEPGRVAVVRDMPAGTGITAEEAIVIRKDSLHCEKEEDGLLSTLAGTTTSSEK